MSQTLDTYDEVLYPSYTHAQTHPDRLSVLARLFAMNPAPVEKSRVLEIGCGDGTNLVAMALGLPNSKLMGIDRAARPIHKGQEMVKALGLKNIELRQLDLMELGSEVGTFDYIIAHGLYSWIPHNVRDRLLSICKSHLAPQGVAFISYNAMPGGHLRMMTREMMLFHVRNFSAPQERIRQAIALVKFLAEAQPRVDAYSEMLNEEFKSVIEHDESSLYHDDLAEINEPIYFHQFTQHAAQHGLQFLAEADYFEMQYHIYPPQVVDVLRQMASANVILKEQYLDFLKCRKFRQTLLCHEGITLDRAERPEVLRELYFASSAQVASARPDFGPSTVEEFQGPRGAKVATDYPLAKAALWHLSKIYPRYIHFDELVAEGFASAAREHSASEIKREEAAQTLAEILLHVYATGLLELYSRAPSFVSHVSKRPLASPLARLQIQQDTTVTNLRLTHIHIEDALARQLLLSLDATKTRAELVEHLADLVQSGKVAWPEGEASIHDHRRLREILAEQIEDNLKKLSRLALLTA